MKRCFGMAIAVFGLLLTVNSALAQDQSPTFVFGEYYVCDQNREGWSDTLVEHVFGPIFDRHVKEGHLLGWGWLGHNAGGEWRRLSYYASNDLNTLLDTRNAIIEELQSKAGDALRELTAICPDHDDYIWLSVASSQPLSEQLADRPETSYSTYFVCDVSRQERADEIVKQLFAPALNRLVASGQIKSWGWLAHVLGGKYRRLLTYSGVDHKVLLAAVEKYGAEVDKENPELSSEFDSICNSHVDYLWDTKIARP